MTRYHTPLALPFLVVLVLALAGHPSPAADSAEGQVEIEPPPPGFALEGDVERGRAVYSRVCVTCHGEDGSGDGRIQTDPPARDLRDASRMDVWSDWEIYLAIRDGGPAVGLSRKMLPWGNTLDEQELHDVALFVRSLSAGAGDGSAAAEAGAEGREP